jgi:MFS family permease
VLLVLCAAAFLVPFMGSSLNLALPGIGERFSMRAVTLTWMATAYIIATAIFQIPFARMADMLGRRRVFEWGLIGFSLFTALSGFAPNGTTLIALRALSGMCSAMMFGTNIAILTASFSPEKRGKVLGINSAVVYAALAAGPFLGGMLTHYLGWQSVFFICGGAGIMVFALSRIFLKQEWIEARGGKFDLVGSVIYGAAIFCLIFGFTKLPELYGFALTVAGVAGICLFAWYERRLASPVLDVKLFSGNRIFALSSLSALINYASNSATAFMLSLYLQYIRGYDARTAGLVLICQACVQSLFSLWSGRMSDRVDATKLATAGMLVSVAGLAGLFFVGAATPVYMIIVILVLLGAGFGIFSSPNTNVIMSSVDARSYSQASATTGTMRLTGQAFSMGIAGMAIALQVGNQAITPALYPRFITSMHMTFGIFAVLCLIGAYASSRRT